MSTTSDISFAVSVRNAGSTGREYLIGSINTHGLVDLGERGVEIYLPGPDAQVRAGEIRLVRRESFLKAPQGETTATIEILKEDDGTGIIVERSQIQIPLIWRRSADGRDHLYGSVEFPLSVDLRNMTWIVYPEFEFPQGSPLRGDAKLILRAENRVNRERANAA